MADEFKPGDVVQVKSGGLEMTVDWVGTDTYTNDPVVSCIWTVNNKREVGKFPPHTLELVTHETGSVRIGRIRRR